LQLTKQIRDACQRLMAGSQRAHGSDSSTELPVVEPPLRSELFSIEQMQIHGRHLATTHVLAPGQPSDQLLARLGENERALTHTFGLLSVAAKANRRITPAGEWLLDNFYLIDEQVRTARRHLPKGYSRELPRLASGPSAGHPRVYDIALETIAHGDGHVDPESLSSFVAAYQSVSTLHIGELWAIPIMLRLALIENLRRVSTRLAADRIARDCAHRWAEQMTQIAEIDPKSLILSIADMARSQPPMVSSFVAEFSRRLQGRSPALALPLTWIEQLLAESGQTIEQSVQQEIQHQAADQASISNSIGSLRFLEAMDWRKFVETMSVVEQKLREDPMGVYARMDFTSRDRYRHVVEETAKLGTVTEADVARKAVQMAHEAAAARGTTDRTSHVGYYLVDQGVPALERALQIRLPLGKALQRSCRRHPLALYLGAITLFAALLTGLLTQQAHASGLGGLGGWPLALVGCLVLLCVSQVAVSLVNLVATLLVTPRPLPRMDFSTGIPAESRTLVVIPSLLTHAAGIDDLLEALEVRFVANRSEHLHFGLLTDFSDAAAEALPEDAPLLERARAGIERLNAKYPGARSDSFFLFHRPRRWNSREGRWMGYERKRGKLADLNALLRGAGTDSFQLVIGRTQDLAEVRYVITLDTDTRLPRDAAHQFIGVMAHPLHRPQYDPARQLISAGYGILQPRVAASLPGANRSRYARVSGAEAGIDQYTRAVSDVYQDLFRQGSFVGKGIYDVDAFERTLKDRFPENRILSHDLLEGCYARSGLLSDVQLYEEDPHSYLADASRRHRWIRGDWQLLRWLFPGVPGKGGLRQRNPLSSLSRWKLFDNLRRSLVPAGLTVLMLLGWTVLAPAWLWTLAIVAIVALPPLVSLAIEFVRKPREMLIDQHLFAIGHTATQRLAQIVFTLLCLPYEAYRNMDAIVRTLWRLAVSRTRLLEWTASGEHRRIATSELAHYLGSMWPAVAIAAAAGILIHATAQPPASWLVAWPVLALWLISPVGAWWISRPLDERAPGLPRAETLFLRKCARRTWAFFDTFVGPDDHWLPPDNYQEQPATGVAHRTSPTNIGIALLSNLSAHDFGYLSTSGLIERTGQTLSTLATLERHRGHFYNWYDTQTLAPLPPSYVSTVDSGNLAGFLLTLGPGLQQLPDRSIVSPRLFDGLSDTLSLLIDQVSRRSPPDTLLQLQRLFESAYDACPTTLSATGHWLARLTQSAEALPASLGDDPDSEALWWAHCLARDCRSALEDLAFLAPWATGPDAHEGAPTNGAIDHIPTLRELATLETQTSPAPADVTAPSASLSQHAPDEPTAETRTLLALGSRRARERIETLERLAREARAFAVMEYDFLYDEERRLLAIGYNVSERRRDSSCYDLLASEARLGNFVAIAQGQLPQESWFALGRLLTTAGGKPVLISWSGSMFEYLMPLLVMPTYDNSLLDQTCKVVIERQVEYGKQRGVPWGISESGYNSIDTRLNYQYRAFGVPGLGLKRGLGEDLVIAPYASVMALMVAPEESCANLQRLVAEGIEGRYGFYEAVDYTAARLPRRNTRAVVRSFMAHHVGMSLLSLAHHLLERPMQQRFEADPLFRATTLLLQERIPKATAFHPHTGEFSEMRSEADEGHSPLRVFTDPNSPSPEVQLLSNGRYHVMLTHSGGGYSRWKDLAVTRWREDSTCDNWGSFCYLRDVTSGDVWSTTHQPTLKQADKYEAIFSEARAEFRRTDFDLDTHTEIAVSAEDDVEMRRITITNRSRKARTIEVTSYAEVVLAPLAADALHPAFSNLFVQTEIIRHRQAILGTRRPRSRTEAAPWMMHQMAAHGAIIEDISYETDRMRFIGRGNTVADPSAMSASGALSGTDGSVLDPIVAIRYRIRIEAERSAIINIASGISESRDGALSLVEKYQDRRLADRVFELAWTHSQAILQQINATEAEAQLYGCLAGKIIYASASLRAEAALLMQNHRGQSGLWGYSISGDLPIVLLKIGDPDKIDLVRQLVRAHAYWRLKGLAADLVIWNEDHTGYRQQLNDQIMGLIAAGVEAHVIDRPGGIFVRSAEHIPHEDRILLQTVARAIIADNQGDLADQIHRNDHRTAMPALLEPSRPHVAESSAATDAARSDLMSFNGLGGFTPDGREYVISTTHALITPAPWVNVLANPNFGTVISESGRAYTWSENAHEYRLTPWHNDPVSDSSGEALYLRDEESGHYWSPMPLPCRGATGYATRHGFGYSVFEHSEDGIHSEAWVYVAPDDAVKYTVIKLRNDSGRPRRLSATGYVEWVLGDLRPKTVMHVITEVDGESGALLARNPYNTEFADRVAFFYCGEPAQSISGDRAEFLGRNGTPKHPAAMSRQRLSGKTGAGLDPCAAIQAPFDLAVGQEREVMFALGFGRDMHDAAHLLGRVRDSATARTALENVWAHWNRTLGAVQVETPDPMLNVLANGWLVYQTLACRLWARSGYYQSGGAFGFRDQLQDTMALVHAEPALLRAQLLLCAGRQFIEGDVQHWWHPPSGRGVRTHCSDDYLWLPLATCRYVLATADTGVLDERAQYLEGRPVPAETDSYYDLPARSEQSGTLYEHCVRALMKGLNFGERGLPLIGSGDWNDGMNTVGEHGKGESVWLGFFLYHTLTQFIELARMRGDDDLIARFQHEAVQLRRNLDQNGWDGEWYRRAYFDDGTPLGSAQNIECQIDSIAQSWSVLSGAGDLARTREAMDSLDKRLVRREHALIQLLDPAFDKTDLNPGYIRGYVPGVRENGGQYSHAAIWAAMAFARLGDSRRAWELTGMLNPANHARSPSEVATYKVEPYVMAADLYAVAPHSGRGGWTWYTGSAGWMYQLIVESLLGLRLEGSKLRIAPCLPEGWQGYKIHYRYRDTLYHIRVRPAEHAGARRYLAIDGVEQAADFIPLTDDHRVHEVEMRLDLP